MGIGFTAFNDREHDFLQVTVNEKPIRLFNSKQLTVSDALILVGFNARKLLAERGDAFQITYNEEKRTILGDYGEPARIYINGGPASLILNSAIKMPFISNRLYQGACVK